MDVSIEEFEKVKKVVEIIKLSQTLQEFDERNIFVRQKINSRWEREKRGQVPFLLNLHFLSKDENDSKGKKIPSEWLSERIQELEPHEDKVKKYFQRNLLPFKSVYELRRFEKRFIRKKGRIWPEKFQKRYWTFLWKRYNIFIKELDRLQGGV